MGDWTKRRNWGRRKEDKEVSEEDFVVYKTDLTLLIFTKQHVYPLIIIINLL